MTVFVDTNVLLYAAAVDYDVQKNVAANALLDRSDCILSAQCINEFVHQSTRETRRRHLSFNQAWAFVETLRRFPWLDVDASLIERASHVRRQTGYSWWDSLIVAAAISAGCEILFTEDLQHGRVVDGVRIENPFRELA